jgi:predicted  nucleic acid-binding Zn-ribbon protein
MNLVGKIFIVLILVMALLWMGFSVAVYATHRNWKEFVENTEESADKPLGLRPQLERQKAENKELVSQRDKLDRELTAETAARSAALTKLEAEKRSLADQRDRLDGQLAKAVQDHTDAVADLRATQEKEAALRLEIAGGTAPDGTQVVGLREEIRQAQAARDEAVDAVTKLTEQLHQARNEIQSLRERLATLTQDLADAKTVLDKHGLKPVPALYDDVPPPVEGKVLEVGAAGLIEISIGSDDGIRKGHVLHVVRQGGGVSNYVGRVEITETEPDKAVCKILPEFLQRPIEREDRVVAKLQ